MTRIEGSKHYYRSGGSAYFYTWVEYEVLSQSETQSYVRWRRGVYSYGSWAGSVLQFDDWCKGCTLTSANYSGAEVATTGWTYAYVTYGSSLSFSWSAGYWGSSTHSASLSHTWTPPTPTWAPNAITGLAHVRDSDAKNTLSWANHPTTARPYASVKVERSVDGGAWSQIASLSGSATSYADTSTSANHSYSYRLRPYNAAGDGAYTAATAATHNTPAAPASVTGSRTDTNTVALDIDNPANTATALELQRSADGEAWETVQTAEGAPVTAALDTPPGGTWYYRARNTRGSLASAWSPASNAVVTICPPGAPTVVAPASGVVVPTSQETIALSWRHNPEDGSAQTAAQASYALADAEGWTDVEVEGDAQSVEIDNAFPANSAVQFMVRTKGAHADYGDWSGTRTFYVRQAPTLVFAEPDSGHVVEDMPLHVRLDYDDVSGTLADLSVRVESGGRTVYERQCGTQSEFDVLPSEWLPENGGSYTLVATARSSSQLSATAMREVSVDFVEPCLATLEVDPDADTGHVSLLVGVAPNEWSETAPAPVAHVEDACAGEPLLGFSVYGETRQNLFPTLSATAMNGVTFTVNEDGSVTVNGTATGWAGIFGYIGLAPGRQYTLSPNAHAGTFDVYVQFRDAAGEYVAGETYIADAAEPVTFTVPGEAATTLAGVYVNAGVAASGTAFPMLAEGAEPQPYSPPGLTSVSSVALNVAGGNLFPKLAGSTANGVTFSVGEDGSVHVSGTATAFAAISKTVEGRVVPGATYTVSRDVEGEDGGSPLAYVYLYDAGGRNLLVAHAGQNPTFTAPPGTHHAVFYVSAPIGVAVDATVWPMLAYGTDAVGYEPCAVSATPIDLQGHELRRLPDGTRDEVRADAQGSLTLVQRVSGEAWDGTQSLEAQQDAMRLAEPVEVPLGAIDMPALPSQVANVWADSDVPADVRIEYADADYGPMRADAESVAVYRVSSNGRTCLGEGLAPGAALVDKYAPVNADYRYDVVAFAASGAYSTREVPARLASPWFYLYWGASGIAKAMWNPERQESHARPSRKRVLFAGRRWPVSFDGVHLSDERTVSAVLLEREHAEAFRAFMGAGGRGVYKSVDGDVFHCDADVSLAATTGMGRFVETVSLIMARIDGEVL